MNPFISPIFSNAFFMKWRMIEKDGSGEDSLQKNIDTLYSFDCFLCYTKGDRYDYGIAPKMIKEEFQALLASYCTEKYWEKIKQHPALVQYTHYKEALSLIASSCSQEALEAFQEYGYDWNVYA